MQVRKMLHSFRYAIRGIGFLTKENNIQFHFFAGILVVSASFYFRLSNLEWCLVLSQIALVLGAEALNTAIEKLCDFVSPNFHPLIGEVKDLAAGAVLIVVMLAVIVGLIIFLPKVIALIGFLN